ncbi:hypothetical protein L6164_032809 [Bauhinia variegata]|uniref:Uncharacterized protein n=1 Tax=Bauhinia variegata TaxID=167791 RepID=A0ACB9KQ75_BAUVA|nr:hypothetical protein L6164_032809 [Bauhinia variegata]
MEPNSYSRLSSDLSEKIKCILRTLLSEGEQNTGKLRFKALNNAATSLHTHPLHWSISLPSCNFHSPRTGERRRGSKPVDGGRVNSFLKRAGKTRRDRLGQRVTHSPQ